MRRVQGRKGYKPLSLKGLKKDKIILRKHTQLQYQTELISKLLPMDPTQNQGSPGVPTQDLAENSSGRPDNTLFWCLERIALESEDSLRELINAVINSSIEDIIRSPFDDSIKCRFLLRQLMTPTYVSPDVLNALEFLRRLAREKRDLYAGMEPSVELMVQVKTFLVSMTWADSYEPFAPGRVISAVHQYFKEEGSEQEKERRDELIAEVEDVDYRNQIRSRLRESVILNGIIRYAYNSRELLKPCFLEVVNEDINKGTYVPGQGNVEREQSPTIQGLRNALEAMRQIGEDPFLHAYDQGNLAQQRRQPESPLQLRPGLHPSHLYRAIHQQEANGLRRGGSDAGTTPTNMNRSNQGPSRPNNVSPEKPKPPSHQQRGGHVPGYHRWSDWETIELIALVDMFGYNWGAILEYDARHENVLCFRNNVQVKDRWRILTRTKRNPVTGEIRQPFGEFVLDVEEKHGVYGHHANSRKSRWKYTGTPGRRFNVNITPTNANRTGVLRFDNNRREMLRNIGVQDERVEVSQRMQEQEEENKDEEEYKSLENTEIQDHNDDDIVADQDGNAADDDDVVAGKFSPRVTRSQKMKKENATSSSRKKRKH